MFVIYLDVTETKQLQHRLERQNQFVESVIEGLPGTFNMFDEEFNILLWNDDFNRFTGYSDEEIKELDPTDFVNEDEQGRAQEAIRQTFEEGSATLESELLTKEGKMIPFLFSGRRFEGEKTTYVLVYGTDISELKTIEHQLRKANEDKQTLLEEIHHRVKNNLAHISSILQMQSFNTDSEEVHRVLQSSQSRIQAIALIHDKLYQHESFRDVRMDSYIGGLAETIERMWANKDKQISYHIEADPIKLHVDVAVTCGALINELVTNATKHAFTDREKGNIWISLEQINGQVQLRVADDGVGLPDDFSLESVDSLGGTLIQTFAQQLDADLSYESDEGTKFEIVFDHPELKDE